MNISNIDGDIKINTKQELVDFIKQSSQKLYDEIWLYGNNEYPVLSILINGNYACVHYFLNDNGDAWLSFGDTAEDIVFYTGNEEEEFEPEQATVLLKDAINCALSFFDTTERPNCIKWQEL